MSAIHTRVGYSGRIKNLREVTNFSEFVEFMLPYGLAKVYMTANRRWSFLDKHRRKIAMAMMINRVLRRFAFNIWDVRTSGGGFMEEYHTMPVIGIISALSTEYARQECLISEAGGLTMATFKLCGEGIITKELKNRIDRLHMLRTRGAGSSTSRKKGDSKPLLYDEAVSALYELEESLIKAHCKKPLKMRASA